MPGFVECVCESKVLLCNDTAGDSLKQGISHGCRAQDTLQTYRSQERVHQPVHLVRWKQVTALQDTGCQVGDHDKMLLQHLAQDITKSIIIFQAADLGDDTESLESFIVQFVYERQMWIGDNNIGQLLYISQAVRETGVMLVDSSCPSRVENLPSGQFRPHVVRRADKSRLSQGTAEERQLSETDGANFTLRPSGAVSMDTSHDQVESYSSRAETGRHGGSWPE